MRSNSSKTIVFLVGVLVGLLAVIGWSQFIEQPAAAQAKGNEVIPVRFAVSSWATNNTSGAYVVDGATGDVFYIGNMEKPRYCGRAEKK